MKKLKANGAVAADPVWRTLILVAIKLERLFPTVLFVPAKLWKDSKKTTVQYEHTLQAGDEGLSMSSDPCLLTALIIKL